MVNRTVLGAAAAGVIVLALGVTVLISHQHSHPATVPTVGSQVRALEKIPIAAATTPPQPGPAPTALEPYRDATLGTFLSVADEAVRQDVRIAAITEETYSVLNNHYTKSVAQLGANGYQASPPSMYALGSPSVVLQPFGRAGYCISATSATGKVWFYDSKRGGLQPPAFSYKCSLASGAS
jgi:hypothetical protein